MIEIRVCNLQPPACGCQLSVSGASSDPEDGNFGRLPSALQIVKSQAVLDNSLATITPKILR